ncbi:TetR/AcrR family transcriptional regulator [Lysinibacillus sp. 54212]|uniref:TetR/AcrR family transcriptional regulator n=1 Tax=Lysinibacillus sp. 54212 TaxID=3119829 RepID=UPI002FC8901C
MARIRKFSTMEIFRETERLLLTVGYEAYNISLLAESLNVSRAAIYKYYTNKEDLVVDFMLDRMAKMIDAFEEIDETKPFIEGLDELLQVIFESKDIHHILTMVHWIDLRGKDEIIQKMTKLDVLHKEMYAPLQAMIQKGKEEGLLNEVIPNALILAFIFQSIAIPNHTNIPKETFLQSIKMLISTGIYKQK